MEARDAGWTGAAYFDLDETLLDISSEKRFAHVWISRKGRLSTAGMAIGWLVGTIAGIISLKPVYDSVRNRMYLRGQSWQEVSEVSEGLVDELAEHLNPKGRERIAWHKEQGHRVVIVSATLMPLAEGLGTHLGVDHVIASKPPLSEKGCLTSREKGGQIPRHKGKAPLVVADAKMNGIELKDCWGYGNSHADGVYMAICGNSVAVNPDRGLLKQAKRNGWQVVHWRSPHP